MGDPEYDVKEPATKFANTSYFTGHRSNRVLSD